MAGPSTVLKGVALGCLVLWGCERSASPVGPTGSASSGERRTAASRMIGEASVGAGVDLMDVIDALFLGSGPLVPRGTAPTCPVPQRVWTAFPRGTTLRLRVSTGARPEVQQALRRSASQVAQATAGMLHATLEQTQDADPAPDVADVTVASNLAPRRAGCLTETGCVQYHFLSRGVLQWARVVEGPSETQSDYVRDVIGRAIMGMCRIDGARIADAGGSLMAWQGGAFSGAAGLTALDMAAAQAVYASAIAPGAPRSEFVRARLVHLHDGR